MARPRYVRHRTYDRLRHSERFLKWLDEQAERLLMTAQEVFEDLLVAQGLSYEQVKADPILYESRSRSLRIRGVVTTLRLENQFWDILREIGQSAPVRLTSVMQKHVDTIRGYPCLISNVTDQQSNSLSMCGLRLAEKGKQVSC